MRTATPVSTCCQAVAVRLGSRGRRPRSGRYSKETGWRVDSETLSPLGFIHFRHLTPVALNHPFPNPDFFQVVLHGEGHGAPDDWIDTEGWVLRSWPVLVTEALALPISACGRAFLALLDE